MNNEDLIKRDHIEDNYGEQIITYNKNKVIQLWIVITICSALFLTLVFAISKQFIFPYPNENDITIIKGSITEIYSTEKSYIISIEGYQQKFIVTKGIHVVNNDAIDKLQNEDNIIIGIEKWYLSSQKDVEGIRVSSLKHDNIDIVTLKSTQSLMNHEEIPVLILMGIAAIIVMVIIIKCAVSIKKEKKFENLNVRKK